MITRQGMPMFAAEFETAQMNTRRRTPRAPVSLNARLGRGGLDRTLCRVTDLSIDGARIHSYSGLNKGTVIWLTLPLLGQVAATVVWADDFEAGCKFQEPLSDDSYVALTSLGGGQSDTAS